MFNRTNCMYREYRAKHREESEEVVGTSMEYNKELELNNHNKPLLQILSLNLVNVCELGLDKFSYRQCRAIAVINF